MFSKALRPASVDAEKMEMLGFSDWYKLSMAPREMIRKKLTKITGPA